MIGNTECPDSKGIKTPAIPAPSSVSGEILNALIQKGLRLPLGAGQHWLKEILNALIQKGLRLGVRVHCSSAPEILNALIQKGLRRETYWLTLRAAKY